MASEECTLLTDQTNYRMTLQTYLKYMQQLGPQRDWMHNQLAPHLKSIFGHRNNFRVLAVGTGSGEVDADFLDTIVDAGRSVHGDDFRVTYQVVEPNQSNVDYFQSVVATNEKLKNVKFEWFVGFFEKFVEEFEKSSTEESRFDFAHFVRCFYHIDSRVALKDTYDKLLRSNGIVAAVGENENAFWPMMMIFLNDHDIEHESFEASGRVSDAYFLPGWRRISEENGWKHEAFTRKYNFDITDMFDEKSPEGNYLVDFAMHAKQARKTVDKKLLDDFFEFLRKHMKEEEVEFDGRVQKRLHFPAQMGAVIITKV